MWGLLADEFGVLRGEALSELAERGHARLYLVALDLGDCRRGDAAALALASENIIPNRTNPPLRRLATRIGVERASIQSPRPRRLARDHRCGLCLFFLPLCPGRRLFSSTDGAKVQHKILRAGPVDQGGETFSARAT